MNPAVDQRPADFYAFGKLAWALLAGRPPLPREQILEPEQRLVAIHKDVRLAPLDGLFRDLLNRDPRGRLGDWEVVTRELVAVDRVLRGLPEVQVRPASERAVVAARRLVGSPAVQMAAERRKEQTRRSAWFSQLERIVQSQGRMIERPLAPITRELGDVLTIGMTSGAGPIGRMLTEGALEVAKGILPGSAACRTVLERSPSSLLLDQLSRGNR